LEDCVKYSENRLKILCDQLEKLESLKRLKSLSAFVCGSYGRLEANPNSDIDLFFINVDETNGVKLSKLDVIVFQADLINILNELKFKELTDDGRYLQIHDLWDIRKKLGSDEDDFLNYFTTRMLLLLESKPICNKAVFDKLLDCVVSYYFKDYHDHEKEFHPVFLLNDILRFWKTLCLNYEHNRHLKDIENDANESEKSLKKAKVHLKNLKLKYSRLMTCYSMVIPLADEQKITDINIKGIIKMNPLDRISLFRQQQKKLVDDIIGDYVKFLKETAEDDILTSMTNKSYRNTQFENARAFSSKMYSLLEETATPTLLRYITI